MYNFLLQRYPLIKIIKTNNNSQLKIFIVDSVQISKIYLAVFSSFIRITAT